MSAEDIRRPKRPRATDSNGDQSDINMLIDFIQAHSQLICTEPAKAYGALKDALAEKEHLIPGSRDILARNEWQTILNEEKYNTTKKLQASQLINWIANTYSTKTAAPWLEAISAHTGQIVQLDRDEQHSETLKPPAKPRVWRDKKWSLIAGAITTLILLRVFNGYLTPLKSDSPKDQETLASNRESIGAVDQPSNSAQEVPEAVFESGPKQKDQLNQGFTTEEEQDTRRTRGQPGHARYEEGITTNRGTYSAVERQKQGINWDMIYRRMENGNLNTTQLKSPEAENLLSHWIQSFKINGNTLAIVLRTRSEASKRICELLLNQYQNAYRNTAGRLPYVVLESSRHAGKDSSSGFLPICQRTPDGEVIMRQRSANLDY